MSLVVTKCDCSLDLPPPELYDNEGFICECGQLFRISKLTEQGGTSHVWFKAAPEKFTTERRAKKPSIPKSMQGMSPEELKLFENRAVEAARKYMEKYYLKK